MLLDSPQPEQDEFFHIVGKTITKMMTEYVLIISSVRLMGSKCKSNRIDGHYFKFAGSPLIVSGALKMSLQTQQLESLAFESKKAPQTTAVFTLKYGDNLIALIFQQFSTAVY